MTKPTTLTGLTFAVLGAAESGVGAAVLAARKGADVWVSDGGKIGEAYAARLQQEGIAFEEGTHSLDRVLAADWVVKSPGIPETAPVMRAVREKGIPVISEIELGSWFTQAKIVAITGTNGKTTTTSLIYHLMRHRGLHVGLGGNIGDSFALQVAEADFDWYVLEVSSFQLDDILHFKPDVALVLNITPDHLDRYEGKMERYAAAKMRITENQGHEDVFIFPDHDPEVKKALGKVKVVAKQKPFGPKRADKSAGWLENQMLVLQSGFRFDFGKTQLRGRHNQLNALAALLAVEAFLPAAAEGLATFQPVAHRMERVGEISGVEFINDSKATNVDSAFYALEGVDRPMVWIAGGVDKGNDYGPLKRFVNEKVNAIVILGNNREKLDQAFPDVYRVATGSMQEAVQTALQLAEPGDAVLLSPACASFDLFKNYEDRGDQFRQEVQNLMKPGAATESTLSTEKPTEL